MRIVAEHPELRRQYQQIVASDARFGFFSQIWVQDCLHANWGYLLSKNGRVVLRIPFVKKLGAKAYLQPLFIRELNLLCDSNDSQYQEIIGFLQKRFFLHLNISIIESAKFDGQIGKFQQLVLSKGMIGLRQGYSDNLIRNLKKSKNLNLLPLTYSVFQDFFISQKGEKLGNLNRAAWQRLEKLAIAAQEKNAVFCYGAYDQGQLFAVALFFRWNDQLYFMKGTLNEEGKKVGALVFLMDAVLEKFAVQCQVLDFIGSNQESIAAFYRKFGAEDRFYGIVKGRIPFV
jgi:hypothetical protein